MANSFLSWQLLQQVKILLLWTR